MGCLRCGSQWRKVVGHTLVCEKCGHIDEVENVNALKCEVCDTICKNGSEAGEHEESTGHNRWTLLVTEWLVG